MNNIDNYAPIILFVYNRIDELKRTIASLKANFGAQETDLIIYSDGPKSYKDVRGVSDVRQFLNTLDGFKKVRVIERQNNMGLADSIINGVSQVASHYGRVIVLEDDLETSRNFIQYMNHALDYYQDDDSIFAINGYTPPIETKKDYEYDNYFTYRSYSWGWATWLDRWNDIDWEIKNYESFKKSYSLKKDFNKGGQDLSRMLKKQMKGKINSWAIRWCYNQFMMGMLSVSPVRTKVSNIGFSDNATNTVNPKEYHDCLDSTDNQSFFFNPCPSIDSAILKQALIYNTNIYKLVSIFKRVLKKGMYK